MSQNIMKYKVGDKVRVVFEVEHYGHTGTISRIDEWGYPHFICSCGQDTSWKFEESLELVENKSITKNTMKKLNNLFKKLTDPSVQKLSEAGILNGDLELTEEGKKELLGVLFLENKDALVKRAEEIIQEAKAEKE